jgi:hypothetical protein
MMRGAPRASVPPRGVYRGGIMRASRWSPIFAARVQAAALAVAILASNPAAGAKSTECARIGVCYCVNTEMKPAIDARVASFRQQIAEQRRAGKSIGYLSVPLSPAGGGYMPLNAEVAQSAKVALEKRYGSDAVFVLNPGVNEANLPAGSGGADYMLMWVTLLEGANGLGEDFDFFYFAGPQDFARVLGLDGSGDMTKLDRYYDQRIKSDPDFDKATKGGLSRIAFRNYYALKASSAFSRGSHDEWNIVRTINERRRADPKLGIANQLPVLFDGHAVAAAEAEVTVSEGYAGKCAP